jgi:6-phosphofructokinase
MTHVSYAIHCGPVTSDEHVLHRCDTQPCVNPEHIFKGDQAANMQDKVRKGRQDKGETHGMVVLKEQDVLAIRARYLRGNGKALAQEFGVSLPTICDIASRRSWRHL